MEFFSNVQVVRLRSPNNQYLLADNNRKTVSMGDNGSCASALWLVEFVPNRDPNSNSEIVLRLKSFYDKYLATFDQLSIFGMTAYKVFQSTRLHEFNLEWEPVKKGTHVKLRTRNGNLLCTNHALLHSHNPVTLDPLDTHTRDWDLWDVEREVIYYLHLWKLKMLLRGDSGRKDVLVRGGQGTTALIREVCADVREQFDTIAWISIPQENDSELIHEEILLQLIFQRVTFPENYDGNPWMSKDHEFSLQQDARCLIVVDNLDDPRTWKKFEEILCVGTTCQVIFIARRKTGSSFSRNNRYGRKFITCKLEDLSYVPREYRWKGFREKGVYQLLVGKCERLPTAIVFIMRNPEKQGPYCSSELIKDEWEARIPSVNLLHELHVIQKVLKTACEDLSKDEDHEIDHIQRVLEILRMDDYRFCFLSLSIFPEDSLISCNRVSRLWAAEGILPDLGRAESFFNVLLKRKCIHPVKKRSDGELCTFKVDNCVRQIIASLSNLGNLVTVTSEDSTNSPKRVRYLSVQGKTRALTEEKPFRLSSILLLDVSSNEDRTTTSKASPSETSETPLSKFNLKHSKMLDLTGAPFQIVQDALKALFELTDLSLRNLSISDTSIKVNPDSIGKLTLLEFLVLKHSWVTELPPEVARLKKIRHILIYHHEKDPLMESYNLIGFKALCRIEELKCLEKLCFVEADDNILEDLGNLIKLRRLGITKLREEHGKKLCSSLEKLTGLKSLNIHAFDEDEVIDLHYLSSPPERLKHLYLHGRLAKLLNWISSLQDLTKIILRWSQLEEDLLAIQLDKDLLAILGKLPNLVELELRRAYNGRQLNFKNKQFPKLKILLLDELVGLRSISLEEGTMPCLEDLIISRCQWLERIPSGIVHIPKIQKLEFFDMSHEFYEMVPNDYRNLKRIRNVYFRQWMAGHWENHTFGADVHD